MIKYEHLINNNFISHFVNEKWGLSILIMEKNGKAFGRIYQYNDDLTSVYLDWLNVYPEIQKNGIGTALQVIREKIGVEIGAEFSYLFVEKDSWMHKWYERRGYVFFKDKEDDENMIWMQKELAK